MYIYIYIYILQGKSGNSLLDKFGFETKSDSEEADPQANVDWKYEVRRRLCCLYLVVDLYDIISYRRMIRTSNTRAIRRLQVRYDSAATFTCNLNLCVLLFCLTAIFVCVRFVVGVDFHGVLIINCGRIHSVHEILSIYQVNVCFVLIFSFFFMNSLHPSRSFYS